jgi:putative ABC transport system substrate-binding protein
MGVAYRPIEKAGAKAVESANSRYSGILRYLASLAFIAAFCSCRAPTAWARVTLVVESQASIYQQAALGFQQGFANVDELDRVYLDKNRLPDNVGKERPRLVVAIGTQAARAAKEYFPDVPILYCLVLQPSQNKLVGTNIGGVTLDVELSQQFENIQKALPQLRRIGVVYDDLTSGDVVKQARQYLKPSVQLVARNVRTPAEAGQEVRNLFGNVLGREDAFWLLWDPVVANSVNFKLLVKLSLEYKVPLIAPARPFVEAGALISVGADYLKAGKQAAKIAQQLLNSEAKAGDFRAEPPQDLVVTINGEVARKLGIRFPSDLRAEILTAP